MLTMQAGNQEALERSQTFKQQQMGSQFNNDWKSSANLYNAGQSDRFKQKDMSL